MRSAADGDRYTVSGVVRSCMLGASAESPARGRHAPIQRRSLFERTAEWFDDRMEIVVVELLAVLGSGRARDVFVHQRAAEVVAAGLQRLACAVHAALRPGALHVVDPAPV